MPNSLTNKGQDVALWTSGGSPVGGIANCALKVKLYTTASTPGNFKQGDNFVQPPAANGYRPVAWDFLFADWVRSVVGVGLFANVQIVLQPGGTDPVLVATGSILNILGAYITASGTLGAGSGLDADSDAVLGWWERTAGVFSLANGDSVTLDDLTIRFV